MSGIVWNCSSRNIFLSTRQRKTHSIHKWERHRISRTLFTLCTCYIYTIQRTSLTMGQERGFSHKPLGGNLPSLSSSPARKRQSMKELQLRTQDIQEGPTFCSQPCAITRLSFMPGAQTSSDISAEALCLGERGNLKGAVLVSKCLLISHSGPCLFLSPRITLSSQKRRNLLLWTLSKEIIPSCSGPPAQKLVCYFTGKRKTKKGK